MSSGDGKEADSREENKGAMQTRRGADNSWSTHQLTEFLTLIASFADERAAIERAVERAAEALQAEVATIVEPDGVVCSVGVPGAADPEILLEVARGDRSSLELDAGAAHAAGVAVGQEPERGLVVARYSREFAVEEVDLLRGMGRVLGLALRT